MPASHFWSFCLRCQSANVLKRTLKTRGFKRIFHFNPDVLPFFVTVTVATFVDLTRPPWSFVNVVGSRFAQLDASHTQ